MGSAYLGGKLVYTEQIGVDHTIGQRYPDEFAAVLPEGELGEGQMRRVEVNGSRVLLARRSGRIFAIAEVCSHLGGPLAEGEFKECWVRCPWHGSRFSLETGQVLDGPSTHPQPCLDVRVVNGNIEVKRG
jgi:nitrite reductase/ring-hydroxylating ferredoxin subunit